MPRWVRLPAPPQLRFDASWITADNVAGTAVGSVDGYRTLVSGGVTGSYGWQAIGGDARIWTWRVRGSVPF